jgi:transcriptional regulator with XRE-family HTH domain
MKSTQLNSEVNIVGERIREIRKTRGLSQKELGDLVWPSKSRNSQSRVANYENGISEPKYNELFKIAEVLNVPIFAFFSVGPVPITDKVTIPIFGLNGQGMTKQGQLPFFWPVELSGKAFALTIPDALHAPAINKDDCLVIDPEATPKIGDIVVFRGEAPRPVFAVLVGIEGKARKFKTLDGNNEVILKGSNSKIFLGVVISRIISRH